MIGPVCARTGVGKIAGCLHSGQQPRVGKPPGQRRTQANRVEEKFFNRLGAALQVMRPDDGADAGGTVSQRNQPAPAMLKPENADIAFGLAGVPGRTAKVGIQRRTVVFGIAALDVELFAKQGVAPRCIDYKAGTPLLNLALFVQCINSRAASVRCKHHIAHAAAFDDCGTQTGRIAQQDLVKLGAPYLVGKRHGLVPRVGKLERLGLARMPGRDKFSAPLLDADSLDRSGHAELLEQRQVGRQQRLADVKARVMFLFKDHHLVALPGQQRTRSGTRRPTANHQHVACAHGGGDGAVNEQKWLRWCGHRFPSCRHGPGEPLKRWAGTSQTLLGKETKRMAGTRQNYSLSHRSALFDNVHKDCAVAATRHK